MTQRDLAYALRQCRRLADPECPECEPVHRAALWKVYIRGFPGFPVGTRFLTAEFDGMALCEEIAAMYNTKPSVVAAGALRFQCEPPQ